MMSGMRRLAATVLSVLIAGCAGTTANAPTTSPTTTATASATASTVAATAGATQATAAALACTAPAAALVELTEGPYYKANPPQNANLRIASVAGTALTLTGYVVSK